MNKSPHRRRLVWTKDRQFMIRLFELADPAHGNSTAKIALALEKEFTHIGISTSGVKKWIRDPRAVDAQFVSKERFQSIQQNLNSWRKDNRRGAMPRALAPGLLFCSGTHNGECSRSQPLTIRFKGYGKGSTIACGSHTVPGHIVEMVLLHSFSDEIEFEELRDPYIVCARGECRHDPDELEVHAEWFVKKGRFEYPELLEALRERLLKAIKRIEVSFPDLTLKGPNNTTDQNYQTLMQVLLTDGREFRIEAAVCRNIWGHEEAYCRRIELPAC